MMSVVYDTGALIAAETDKPAFWKQHRRTLAGGVAPIVLAPVLAQAWRGGRKQTQLARALRGCDLIPFTPHDAYGTGTLLAAARTADIVDAAVVLAAITRTAVIITSDPDDLHHLADVLGVHLELITL